MEVQQSKTPPSGGKNAFNAAAEETESSKSNESEMKKMSLLHTAKKQQRRRLLSGPQESKLHKLEIGASSLNNRRQTDIDQKDDGKQPTSALLPN